MALNVEDIAFLDEGVAIRVADPRTDAAGSAREVFIARGRHPETCPVRALDQWLSLLDRRDGPMFVRMYKGGVVGTSRAGLVLVDHVVKRRAQLSGVDGHYTAHSLRSGLAASAAEGGADYLTILRQTGHVSLASFTGYLQAPADVDQNVMQYLDL